MNNGKVKWFNSEKGFGFITGDNGQDYFVHYRSIVGDGYRSLDEGMAVEFEIQETDKGSQAVNVKKK